jgi:magnesium-transporting ATPase (P-type)
MKQIDYKKIIEYIKKFILVTLFIFFIFVTWQLLTVNLAVGGAVGISLFFTWFILAEKHLGINVSSDDDNDNVDR